MKHDNMTRKDGYGQSNMAEQTRTAYSNTVMFPFGNLQEITTQICQVVDSKKSFTAIFSLIQFVSF